VMILDHDGLISRTDSTLDAVVPKYPRKFEPREDLNYYFSNDAGFVDSFESTDYTLLLEFDGYSINDGSAVLYYKDLPSRRVIQTIENAVENAMEQHRVLDSLHVSFEDYKRMKLELTILEKDIEKPDEEESHKAEQAIVGLAFAFVIYMFIFIYGVQVMRGVIEEKTNRVVEVIVSSVKPFQLMIGKVVGIGMVGLTQFLLWVILCSVVTTVGSVFLASSGEVTSAVVDGIETTQDLGAAQMQQGIEEIEFLFAIPWGTVIFCFVFYFIGGYLLYGALFAAIGSAVDSETDTQQFMLPVAMPLVFGFIITTFLIMNPEGIAGDIFAIVPFTSPVVMMVKASMGDTGWLMVISMIVLILSFLGTIWLAGRIYRTGILMYGKKTTYKELWKWIRYKG
ncbi:MAG: ABC transporter permease, partial [Flavobacteriales bacterium]|nr:ABC transporter permease [Flavobacteriales bacterium]